MLVYRTIAKTFFREFDSIIMQNLGDILQLFCTPTWPSHHVGENQEPRTADKTSRENKKLHNSNYFAIIVVCSHSTLLKNYAKNGSVGGP